MDGLNIATRVGEGQAYVFNFDKGINEVAKWAQQDAQNAKIAQQQLEKTLFELEASKQKLRTADQPEYLENYNGFSAVKTALVTGKIKDPAQVAKLQRQADQYKANMMRIKADSDAAQEAKKAVWQGVMTDPSNFDPEINTVMRYYDDTPSGQLKQGNLVGFKQSPFAGQNLLDPLAFRQQPAKYNLAQHDLVGGLREKSGVEYNPQNKGEFRKVKKFEPKNNFDGALSLAQNVYSGNVRAGRAVDAMYQSDAKDGTAQKIAQLAKQKLGRDIAVTRPDGTIEFTASPAEYWAVKQYVTAQIPEPEMGAWEFTDAQKEQNARDRQDRAAANAIRLKNTPSARASGGGGGSKNTKMFLDPATLQTALLNPDAVITNDENGQPIKGYEYANLATNVLSQNSKGTMLTPVYLSLVSSKDDKRIAERNAGAFTKIEPFIKSNKTREIGAKVKRLQGQNTQEAIQARIEYRNAIADELNAKNEEAYGVGIYEKLTGDDIKKGILMKEENVNGVRKVSFVRASGNQLLKEVNTVSATTKLPSANDAVGAAIDNLQLDVNNL